MNGKFRSNHDKTIRDLLSRTASLASGGLVLFLAGIQYAGPESQLVDPAFGLGETSAQISNSFFLILSFVLLVLVIAQAHVINRAVVKPYEVARDRVIQMAGGGSRLRGRFHLRMKQDLCELAAQFSSLNLRPPKHEDAQASNEPSGETDGGTTVRDNQKLIRQVLDMTPSPLGLVDAQRGRFVYINRKMAEFFEEHSEELLMPARRLFFDHLHPDDLPVFDRLTRDLAQSQPDEVIEAEFRLRSRRGDWRWVSFRSLVVERMPDNTPSLILHTCDDITQDRREQNQLLYNSTHDVLTGLYNRAYFENAVEQIRREGGFPVAVIMMDVDNLKEINDTRGHSTGDELLRRIAGIIMTALRAEDILARMGGDEFSALLPGVADEESAQKIIDRMRRNLREATNLSTVPLDAVSIGFSIARSPDSLDAARLEADRRMYADKRRRKGNACRTSRTV